ncbi:DNA polymerase III subunit delta' [Rhodospirillum centenum]|uniref:ATPase i n=1 Tax=Rhodospirillum centenum (strain ATCC 51521 / SW) TaxID=414684 RepID=B6IMK3_RHOCS|nr:DNA polymerase III subunit delta' [Rhodospirillum centenum]ACI98582.1 ATPase i [Rhodospirillum centenum SW]
MSRPEDGGDDPFAPRRNPHLVGHEQAERLLLESWTSGRMHHAWLIGGPPGIGKATLAFRMARFVLKQGTGGNDAALFGAPPPPVTLAVDTEHPVARRIAAGGHADLLTVQRTWDEKRKRFKRDLPVDEVRRIAPFLRLTSAEGGWRVVVVDGADQMNLSGQNALLKILEEPPARSLILMAADNVGSLLPTIRSRSRKLMLEPLPEATVVGLLGRYAPELDREAQTALARLAEGSIGRALDLHHAGGLDLYRQMLGLLETLPRLDVLAAYGFIDKVLRGNDDAAWSAVTDLLVWWLGRLARTTARGQLPGEVVAGEGPLIARLVEPARRDGGLDRWVEVWENTTRLFARADSANLDRRQVLLNALLSIETAAA